MHAPTRSLAFLPAVLALLALTAVPVLAKEGGVARLDAPIPVDAAPGTELEIGWSVFVVDDAGTAHPIVGSPVYLRLVPAGGGTPVEVDAIERPSGSGHYVTAVVVPDGGIGRVEVAMHGEACDATGCRDADYVFPMHDDPAVAVPPFAGSDPAASGSAATTDQGPLAVLVAAVAGLAALGALLALVVGRRGAATVRPA